MGRAPKIDGDDGYQKHGAVSRPAPGLVRDGSNAPAGPPGSSHSTQSGEYLGDFGADNDTAAIENVPPPPYSESYGTVDMGEEGFNSRADVAMDGRINIDIDEKARRLSNLIAPSLLNRLEAQLAAHEDALPPGYIPPSLVGADGDGALPPSMNVVIHVVGSRGDVQPFIALGLVLKRKYHHRVRLATHAVFRDFVLESGLEFFNIGGDPAGLMAFMVKNPGLLPNKEAFTTGEIEKRRKEMYEILRGCWRSCFEAGEGASPAANNDRPLEDIDESTPFVADAIIANPPSFAHIHCAERLGIPLHLMFTMPWSPTASFPHPLANIRSTNVDGRMTNYLSYMLVEMMTWQGLGDLINRFREKTLGLEPISQVWGPGINARLRIPYTYCWSPALIPKPPDWARHINIAGFFFLDLAQGYQPPDDLARFLDAGPPPVYIGFGSIVVDDPQALTNTVFHAIQKTGQRVLLSKGWGGIGTSTGDLPEGVFMIGNVPHDWLFDRVSCVVHHGGAGTTAAGISAGKPTVIVPFFGDQPFWGAMVAKAGSGPNPIPHKELNADNLADAIKFALQPATVQKAEEIGAKIQSEDGSEVGAQSFLGNLDAESLRCAVAPSHAAVWQVKKTGVRLSALAASVLTYEGLLQYDDLKLFRPREYDVDVGPLEPMSGAASAVLGAFTSIAMGVLADVPAGAYRASKTYYKESDKKKKAKASLASHPTSEGIPGNSSESSLPDPILLEPTTSEGSSLSSKTQSSSAASKQPSSSSIQGLTPSPQDSHKLPSMTLGSAAGAGKGVARIIDSGLKSPMDFSVSIARGFHNAPRLYGDDTVRTPDRVTGLQSGLMAAGKEFGLGFYDGIAGFVTQPVRGAKKEGFTGALKGFGKGVGGLMLKPGAALFAIPAYTMQGAYKEVQKILGSSVQSYIVTARMTQGFGEWNDTSPGEREEIVKRWRASEAEGAKNKRKWYGGRPSMSKVPGNESSTSLVEDRSPAPSIASTSEPQVHVFGAEDTAIPPTIKLPDHSRLSTGRERGMDEESVIATSPQLSEGDDTASPPSDSNPAELPALPIRTHTGIKRKPVAQASARETREPASDEIADDESDDELRLAIKASIDEASKRRFEAQGGGSSSSRAGGDEDAELEAAIRASLVKDEELRDEDLERVLKESWHDQ